MTAVSMADAATWTLDFLPLVRRQSGDLWPELGLLLPKCGPVVFLVNAFEPGLGARLKTCERVEYATFQACRDAGWRPD